MQRSPKATFSGRPESCPGVAINERQPGPSPVGNTWIYMDIHGYIQKYTDMCVVSPGQGDETLFYLEPLVGKKMLRNVKF